MNSNAHALSSGELRVCETFVSIQGESTHAGCQCFFIRLAGCNLRCSYCDTKYAYENGKYCSASELADDFRNSGVRLVEVTGGEPLLQPATIGLLKELEPHGTVLLETNGSLDISRVPESTVIIMDIKCPGSGESDSVNMQNIALLRPKDEVKFVVRDRADFEWATEFARDHGLADRCRAVLMSPASGMLDCAELAEWIIGERFPFRLNLRMHEILRRR